MKIRAKITLLFSLLVILLLFGVFYTVYSLFENYRQDEYQSRLVEKSDFVLDRLTDLENVSKNLYKFSRSGRDGSLYDENVAIFDSAGSLLFNLNFFNLVKISQLAKNADVGKGAYYLVDNQFDFYVKPFISKGKKYVIVVSAYDKYGYSKLAYLRFVFSVILGISIALSLIIGWFYAGRILRPVSKMIEDVDTITAKNLSTRLEVSDNKDELNQLAQTFNRMLWRIDEAFKAQELFVANASHELRTPLTSLTGQIEITLLKERSNDEYKAVLESILEDIKNLNSISNSLIHLIQADINRSDVFKWPVRIDDIIWQVEHELKNHYQRIKINIEFENLPEDEDAFTVMGEANLLKTCFRNLIENACKFTTDSSVTVKIAYNENEIYIRVINAGIIDDQEELKMIYQPFYRGKSTMSKPGHGLGLAIVSKIVNLFDGQLEFTSQNGFTEFILTLRHR